MSNVECHKLPVVSTCCFDMLLVWTGLFDMSNVDCCKLPVASTCCFDMLLVRTVLFDMSNVECYKLPVASTCCLLPFNMSKQHVERCFDMLLVWTGLNTE